MIKHRPLNRLKRFARAGHIRLALTTVVGFAALAAPSAASASLHLVPAPTSFQMTSSAMTWSETSGGIGNCNGAGTTSGSWSTGTAGTTTLKFEGCKWGVGACTSVGQPSGTIVSSSLTLTPVYLNAGHTAFGLLLSPKAGAFAEFNCGIIHRSWTGSLLGQITNPGLNLEAINHTLAFKSLGSGVQQYTQVEGAGPTYSLVQNGNTSVAIEAGQAMQYVQMAGYRP